ncbi:2,5-diamino-6-(ribosylamino)-4(3H)-pyrimidinone 5'-phosphate reductase [Halovivax limisalsi]|uniref:2,5-diamino-6-(ribosylamino)-4(3H)-pyrimidinone 5'-phosphate reductase n=1 Tax=Halovivax limisalsi TaxID=1453760 RepID=UPI001FFC786A|nr:2,5-diamino-6-(ribosylamino)-4(3H)-pyrimidinone 5'-phosphate reductase [Halovivax limisalsi]
MHVTVNAAMSADGKLSTRERVQHAISGEADFDRVDRLRADADAVVVGVGTVLADDPSLTVKDADRRQARADAGREANPARVVADSTGRTPADAAVLDDDADTYLLVSEDAPADRRATLAAEGANLIVAGTERVDLLRAFAALEDAGLEEVLVEGGGELCFSLFDAGLVDDLSTFVGPTVIGGRDAPTLVDGAGFVESFPELSLDGVEELDDGVVIHWQVAR